MSDLMFDYMRSQPFVGDHRACTLDGLFSGMGYLDRPEDRQRFAQRVIDAAGDDMGDHVPRLLIEEGTLVFLHEPTPMVQLSQSIEMTFDAVVDWLSFHESFPSEGIRRPCL